MKTVTAAECQARWEQYLKIVRRESISLEEAGEVVAVLLSQAEYDRLTALENAYWLERARDAEADGYVGSEKAMALLMSDNSEEMENAEA